MDGITKMKKKIKRIFATAVFMSVGFAAGVPLTILGAVNGMWVLMALGIACIAAGFYGTPLMWVRYGNMRRRSAYLAAICEDGITDIDELAETFRASIQTARDNVNYLITNRYLTGYAVKNDKLENTTERKKRILKKCAYCGMTADKDTVKCPNCNAVMTEITEYAE